MSRIDEIQARLNLREETRAWTTQPCPCGELNNTVCASRFVVGPMFMDKGLTSPNTAEFIANAPEDIAWLLAEVKRLRGLLL